MLRRNFLQFSALPLLPTAAGKPTVSCILLVLSGGPSHLDTWDMKPDAPSNMRGPFRPIRTNVPGIEISEIFPRMAGHADKFALIRSVHYDGPAVHETGLELMGYPHMGSVVAQATGTRHVVLGQRAGVEPISLPLREKYGLNSFGRNCLRARQLVEAGTRFVTVNMFDTVFDQPTWDSHGSRPFSSISDYATTVGPMFDNAYSSLLEDLSACGLLATTLVVGMGEFGRGPKINPSGGRDHWPQCWTIHMAGGGIEGGQIYGSSDRLGMEPRDNPVTPQMVAATIYRALDVSAPLSITNSVAIF